MNKVNEDEAVKLSQNGMINTKMAPTQIEYDKKLFNERYKEEISKYVIITLIGWD